MGREWESEVKQPVLVTQKIPERALALVRETCDVRLDPPDQRLTPVALQQAVVGMEGMICLVTDQIDAQILEAGAALRIVANVAVGYDNIDVRAATQRGIVVTNTPGAVTEATADLTWGLLLSVARRIAEGDRYIRAGKWHEWQFMFMLGCDVYDRTLGIIGMGRIGQAVARRAQGFGMRVLYHNRQRLDATVEKVLGATWVELPTLMQQADFVSVHVPLMAETIHLIGAAELRLMQPTAYLINTARGAVIDEAGLVRALTEGWIAGAALDVFEREPEVSQALLALENVVLVPHIGSASAATRTRMAVMAAENLLAVLRSDRPPNIVNPEVYG
jgi:glyoxylate reductase